ncbi:transporter substrate-binding domain-containing protein [Shewanella avicenniae]|uniref:Transporter substrate-binding domain-containing protein n=1 Tax=Shewanella avicenniae TaxID=2814294 RepID=A0ABX7QLD7_9GAMM|nr:transporter substrate-binding domain-containing protein [Shewanella avicenniae]QSX32268.1 transporter substrate-binding domain-containing protein [Shewanella avicenniae]
MRCFTRLLLWLMLLPFAVLATELVVLKADFRPRPPEMRYGNTPGSFEGPLVELLETACERAGCKIEWQDKPFPRTMRDIRIGQTHIVPRLIYNKEREEFTSFIGPVAVEPKPILFVTHKNNDLLNEQQLFKSQLGVKLGTYYSEFINHDDRLSRTTAADDANLVKMFAAKRFDFIAVIDKLSIEKAFRDINYSDYQYATFYYPNKMPIYYGFSKVAGDQEFIAKLQHQFEMMILRGEINEIYARQ